jgi:Fur family ferric uptake transcriptional regulator
MGVVRKTKSVNLLLNAFEQSESALSVVQLVDNLSDHMNKTTVYRILDRLEQEGMVHSFYGKDGLKWYAKCSQCTSHEHSGHHPHLQCKDCGVVELVPVEIPIPNIPNIQIDSAEIMFTGTCSNCLGD